MDKGKRNSNFEILRIIGIIMITAYHYNIHGLVDIQDSLVGGGKFVLLTSSLWGKAGVNIFSLITGYFMINRSASFTKLWNLEAQVLFFTIAGLITALVMGQHVGMMIYISSIFPIITCSYWFITAYFLVYLFSPYFNKLMFALDGKERDKFMLILYIVWCIIPFFTNQKASAFFWNQFIWFVVMYFTGGYLRLNKARYEKRVYLWAIVICAFSLVLCSFIIDSIVQQVNVPREAVRYFAWSNSPFIIVICVSMLRVAELSPFKSYKVINRVSSLVIGMYLFQENVIFSDLCWKVWFDNSEPITMTGAALHLFYSIILVCVIGGLAEYVRSVFMNKIIWVCKKQKFL